MSSADQPDIEVDRKLVRGPRRDLLEALVAHGGRASTPSLSDWVAVDPNGTRYHLDILGQHGLVEQDGEEQTANRKYANAYRITDEGETIFAASDERAERMTTMADMKARNEALEARVETLEAQMDELTEDEEIPV